MYRDLDNGKIYDKWQLFKKWFAIDDDIMAELERKGIKTFEQWLNTAINYGRYELVEVD